MSLLVLTDIFFHPSCLYVTQILIQGHQLHLTFIVPFLQQSPLVSHVAIKLCHPSSLEPSVMSEAG